MDASLHLARTIGIRDRSIVSFDHSHARARSPASHVPLPAPLPPGKRSGTDRLVAPVSASTQDRIDGHGEAAAPALTGTAWLAGVLGFGDDITDTKGTTTVTKGGAGVTRSP